MEISTTADPAAFAEAIPLKWYISARQGDMTPWELLTAFLESKFVEWRDDSDGRHLWMVNQPSHVYHPLVVFRNSLMAEITRRIGNAACPAMPLLFHYATARERNRNDVAIEPHVENCLRCTAFVEHLRS